ncbi:MAG: EAL domain-containing protein [Devosiaceae bacterium]
MRPSVALIYIAIAVISISVGAMLFRLTPLPLEIAVMFGAILFFALAAVDQGVSRATERKTFQRQLELNDHALQDAFNEIDMIRSRMVALETDTQQMVDAGVAPVHQDMQAVGALLAQVTETVADADHRLISVEEGMQAFTKRLMVKPQQSTSAPVEETTDEPEAASKPKAGESKGDKDKAATQKSQTVDTQEAERSQALLKRVGSAIANERFEVNLQSIVTLPQRRARGYALLFNLKLDGAGTLEARHAVPAAEAVDAIAAYDTAIVRRALALAERFSARESASMVFMPINGSALMQSGFSDWLVKMLTDCQDLAGRVVIEIPQRDVRAFSPLDFDVLGQLYDLGFRMSVSQLTDARSDLFDLSRHGFRYAKAPASLFLAGDAASNSDIHTEDLSDLAARNGMDLIVDQVESESQVVELLDCKLKYGQGNVFARPRAVDVEPKQDLDPSQDLNSKQELAQKDGPIEEPGVSAVAQSQPKVRAQRSARSLSRTA